MTDWPSMNPPSNWPRFVALHAGEVYRAAKDSGLDSADLPTACELAWLRLSERLRTDALPTLDNGSLSTWVRTTTLAECNRLRLHRSWQERASRRTAG